MGSRLDKTSNAVRKRIEQHTFDDEEGEEYEPSKFGGFPDYFRRKKIKLQNRDAARRGASDKPAIFKGIVAHVNGYTQPSLNDIHNMIIDYGGGFLQYLDGKTMVTHIIASNLTPKKKVEFKRYRIVKPAWVVDSIAAGKLLPWENYRVVDEGVRQNLLGFNDGQMVSQSNNARTGYKEQTDTSWYTEQMRNAATRIDTKPDSSVSGSQFRAAPIFSTAPAEGNDEKDDVSDELSDHVVETHVGEQQASFSYGSFDEDVLSSIEREIIKTPPRFETGGLRNESSDEAKEPSPDIQSLDEEAPEEESMGGGPDATKAIAGAESMAAAGLPPNLVLKDDLQKFGGRKLTAEEHNAILLSDPKIWKSSTVNPGFLKQYYEESRLHHLSAWKAELKSRLQAQARELTASQHARKKRPPGSRRYIFHVDFDSFFVAVSLLKHPEMADKPAVVAHGDGSGSEIASCNYPARKFGVKNGMWMKTALGLCPDIKILPYDFKAYEDASKKFYSAIIETGGIVQSVSVDEALIDLSLTCVDISGSDGKGRAEGSVYREEARAQEIARDLRIKIKADTGCEVSIGIGGNILLAKIALRKAKPAGQHLITPDAVLDTIGDLNVQDLPGVAYSMGSKLEEIGIKYVKDIRSVTKERLTTTLGPKTGEKLWEYARGIDRAEVGEQVVRKSVSAEVNWGVRFVTQEQADEFIKCLCEELEKRLRNENVKGRQFTMKIMRRSADSPLDPPKHLGHGKCDVFNKSIALGVPTFDAKILTKEALSILRSHGFPPGELRGIGMQMTKLEAIKGATANLAPPGQRPLQFAAAPKLEAPRTEDPDEIQTPEKPVKFIKHPAANLTIPDDGKKPASLLNTLGTQFVLPTQVDPAVLAELPEDIKAKLTKKGSAAKENKSQPKLAFGRSVSPAVTADEYAIPSASQLDPEVLAALPDDLRAEILGARHVSPQKANKQSILPQSPHRNKTIKLTNKITPTKSKGSSLARLRDRPKDSTANLKQANFAKTIETGQPKDSDVDASHDDEVSAEFLAALPEDIRLELLDQQRRERLKRKGGLEMGANKKKIRTQAQAPQRVIELPMPPPKPSFTSLKLTSVSELRDAVSDWYNEFQDEEPNVEDVEVLCTYLRRVILEEMDMSKAVSVVKWLFWTIEQDDRPYSVWQKAADMLRSAVQDAVKQRGVGPVSFD